MKKLVVFLALAAGVVALAISTGAVDKVVKWQVQSALEDSGLSEERAACMSARMVDRLSITQLRQLQSGLAAQDDEAERPEGIRDVIKRARRVGDAETIAVTVSSAGLCAIGIG